MKLIWELAFTILKLLKVIGSCTKDSSNLKQHLKLAHPTLYRKAKYELLAEDLMENLPGVDFAEALEAVKGSFKHRGDCLYVTVQLVLVCFMK